MELDEAFRLIAHAITDNRAAPGYLLAGDLAASCEVLVARLLEFLFPQAKEQVTLRLHPDIAYLEPQGASRTITVAMMREQILDPMAVTSYSGGWKVGVISSADRLQVVAANAFLKTLEEPPPQTLFLLTTDSPDLVLPTIISRTQRVDLPLSAGTLTGEGLADLRAAFLSTHGDSAYAKVLVAQRAMAVFEKLEEQEEGDLSSLRKAFFRTVMAIVREWMLEGRLPWAVAFRNFQAVETAYQQCDRALNVAAVLAWLVDRLSWPKETGVNPYN